MVEGCPCLLEPTACVIGQLSVHPRFSMSRIVELVLNQVPLVLSVGMLQLLNLYICSKYAEAYLPFPRCVGVGITP